MSKSLFNAFESVSSRAWKQKIQLDLKGADYNKSLIWNSPEGIDVKPFYHSDEFDGIKTSSSQGSWNISQSIFVKDPESANRKALELLDNGVDSIKFVVPSKDISIETLLQKIDTASNLVYFEFQFLSEEFLKEIMTIPSTEATHFQLDIIGNLAKSGNWYHNLRKDFDIIEKSIANGAQPAHLIAVNASLYQNAGANMVQQLAYTMAHANEYLNHFENSISKEAKTSFQLTFNVSVGTNYFFEIAKLRALRLLYRTLASAYNGFDLDCHVVATPTRRNKTIYDYNSNMLRTTTESMSAILGGANTICNLPYDAIYHKDNAFGERISRNQLLILKHESYFNKVNNPADGAYYIESLTRQMAQKALALFKDIEDNGGFLKQLKAGTIQRKIKDSAAKEQVGFDSGEDILLGTNKYPNPNDRMKQDLELYPFVKTKVRKTLIEPIIEIRLAEILEKERLKNEN